MSLPSFPLRTEQDRARAIQILHKVDLTQGITWTMREEVRSDAQNRRMWAMLRDVSKQVVWHGKKLSDEDWKHVFSASLKRQKAVPGLDGGFVVLGQSTSKMTKAEMSELQTLMEAFGAEKGVRFSAVGYE